MNYRDNFNHLGEMREGDYQPWTLEDRVVLALFVVGVVFLTII